MPLSNLFRRKKSDPEAERRARLLQGAASPKASSSTSAPTTPGPSHKSTSSYEVSGVEYESSQMLDDEQRGREIDYAPGARITIRYDPQRPGNSVVV